MATTTFTHNGAPFFPVTEAGPPTRIRTLGQPDQLTVYAAAPKGTQSYRPGDDITMNFVGAFGITFAGFIDRADCEGYTSDGQYLRYRLTCLNYAAHLRRLLYTGTHAHGASLTSLFTDMRDQTRYDTLGITNPSLPGGAFRQFSGTWENVPVGTILDEMADYFSWWWTVNTSRQITIIPFSSEVVDGTTELSGRSHLTVKRSNDGYANRVTIIGSDGPGQEITESVTRKTDEPYFKLTHRVAAVDSATLGGSAATIGQRGVERASSFDLLWQEGSDIVEVQSPVGGSSDTTMTVTYTPIVPIRAVLSDPEEINRYGIVEDKPIQNSNIRTPEKALELAEARLYYTSRYRAEKIKVYGNPANLGIQNIGVGVIVELTDTNFDIDGQYVSVSAVATEVASGIWLFDFDLETKRGPQSWPEIMRRILDIGKKTSFAGELVSRPVSHTDAVTCTHTVTLT